MSALWSTDRPEFAERVAKLAGGTTYRTPASGGRGDDNVPDAHAIAAALAFARRGPDDIGPDVAYCWVLQSDAYRQRVTRRLSIMLRSHTFRTMASHRLLAAEAAWSVMIHGKRVKIDQPADLRPYDWDRLLLAALAELHDSAWEALAEAEKRYHMVA
jgi:hypothetical protein